MVREWRNRPEVAKYMFSDHVITPEEQEAWFHKISHDQGYKIWIIVCDGVDVGLANLYNIDFRNSRCYWGSYVAAPALRGKGIGSFVEFLVLTYVFDHLQLHKLCCEVMAFNRSAIDVYRSFGFKEEGVLRDHVFKAGSRHDVVVLGILREEWESQRHRQMDRMRARGFLPPFADV
jgi:UDP-4-amino-4,6-dideoxy-N-acetyl-beta-L-altrosamine N-acetyltransferase